MALKCGCRGSRAFSTRRRREAFGSFHSADIEMLLRSSAAVSLPAVAQEIELETLSSLESLLRPDRATPADVYALDRSWTFLNHGAFGATLQPLLIATARWRSYAETQPLRFFDRDLFPLLAHTLRVMAAQLQCAPQQLCPLPNVTAGLNAVLLTLLPQLQRHHELLHLSLTYGSTKKMLRQLAAQCGAQVVNVPLPLPLSSEAQIIDAVLRHVTPQTRLVVLDAITSNTALALPIVDLAPAIKRLAPEAVVVVDAAHALWAQPVDLRALPAVDLWLTNGHKWLSGAKGCALLWRAPHAPALRPAIVSHGFSPSPTQPHISDEHRLSDPAALSLCRALRSCRNSSRVVSGFAWDGCRDYAALVSLAAAPQLWTKIANRFFPSPVPDDPIAGCRQYIEALLTQAEALLCDMWQLDATAAFVAPASMRQRCPMRLIPLPRTSTDRDAFTDDDAFQLQELLHHHYRIECPVKCLDGKLYVRISAHIYNRLDDYRRLGAAVKELLL